MKDDSPKPWLVLVTLPLGLLAAMGVSWYQDRHEATQVASEPAPPPTPPSVKPDDVAQAVPKVADDEEVGMFPEPAWLLRCADALGLKDEQIGKLKDFQKHFEEVTAGDREKLERESAAFMDWLRSQPTKIDPAEAAKRDEASREVSDRIAEARKNTWMALWPQLTPEQQAKLKHLRQADPFALR